MTFSFKTPVWFYTQPIDFRKQLDGLIILIADQLQMNPASGELYIFRNRSSNRLKMLWRESNGFWFCYRRLEGENFVFPQVNGGVMELSRDQLGWLLSGLNFMEHKSFSEIKAVNFY